MGKYFRLSWSGPEPFKASVGPVAIGAEQRRSRAVTARCCCRRRSRTSRFSLFSLRDMGCWIFTAVTWNCRNTLIRANTPSSQHLQGFLKRTIIKALRSFFFNSFMPVLAVLSKIKAWFQIVFMKNIDNCSFHETLKENKGLKCH